MDDKLQSIRNAIREDYEVIDFFPVTIQEAYEVVRSKYEEGELSPPIELDEILRKVQSEVIHLGKPLINVLTKKELRYLPYLAYQGSPELISDDKIFSYIEKVLKNEPNSTLISSWVHNYLKNKLKDSMNHRVLGELLKKSISNYNGKSNRCNLWKLNADLIFSDESKIAKHILSQGKSFRDLLIEFRLSTELNTSDWATLIIKSIIDNCSISFPRYLPQCLEELKLKDSSGKNYYRDIDVFRYAASKLVKSAGISCEDSYKEKIKKPLLLKLKDPRISSNEINWSGVETDSKSIFKQWLSARDIEFFFEIVSRTETRYGLNTHWEYRKAFWMAYLPYIEDTWVLMGSSVREFAKIIIQNSSLSQMNFGVLQGGESTQSVFFLRVNGVDIVEYSHNGASRIWALDKSPLDFRKSRVSINKFRRDAPPELRKFSHHSSEAYRWQREISYWMRKYLDIEPNQSYRL